MAFKDAEFWVSLFLGERAGLPRGSDTLRSPAASLSLLWSLDSCAEASDASLLQG